MEVNCSGEPLSVFFFVLDSRWRELSEQEHSHWEETDCGDINYHLDSLTAQVVDVFACLAFLHVHTIYI